ncbi:MAG: hypothetical protein H7039_12625 [Bryobacteraceae bacterium]|nr:hypothetical protein [Bryobacteraceae bacterium]
MPTVLLEYGTIVIMEVMQTVFEAAGGNDGLRDLAGAWQLARGSITS